MQEESHQHGYESHDKQFHLEHGTPNGHQVGCKMGGSAARPILMVYMVVVCGRGREGRLMKLSPHKLHLSSGVEQQQSSVKHSAARSCNQRVFPRYTGTAVVLR